MNNCQCDGDTYSKYCNKVRDADPHYCKSPQVGPISVDIKLFFQNFLGLTPSCFVLAMLVVHFAHLLHSKPHHLDVPSDGNSEFKFEFGAFKQSGHTKCDVIIYSKNNVPCDRILWKQTEF